MAKADSNDITIAPGETSRRDFSQVSETRKPRREKNGGANSQSFGRCVYLTTLEFSQMAASILWRCRANPAAGQEISTQPLSRIRWVDPMAADSRAVTQLRPACGSAVQPFNTRTDSADLAPGCTEPISFE